MNTSSLEAGEAEVLTTAETQAAEAEALTRPALPLLEIAITRSLWAMAGPVLHQTQTELATAVTP